MSRINEGGEVSACTKRRIKLVGCIVAIIVRILDWIDVNAGDTEVFEVRKLVGRRFEDVGGIARACRA